MSMTKNKKKLRRVERRYSVTKSAQTLVLAGMLLLGAGAAQAADNVTITDAKGWNDAIVFYEQNPSEGGARQKVIVNAGSNALSLTKRFDTNEFTMNSGTLTLSGQAHLNTDAVLVTGGTINTQAVHVAGGGSSYVSDVLGMGVDTDMTVQGTVTDGTTGLGTVNTGLLDVRTYVDTTVESQGATFTIDNGGRVNVSGDVNVQKFKDGNTVGADAQINIKNGGHLRIGGKLTLVDGGKITVNGRDGSIYFDNDATLAVGDISSNGADGIILTGGGQVYGKKRLTLTGNTLAAAHGNVKASYMTIGDGTGSLEVKGGELKVYGKEFADDPTPLDQVLLAGTITAKDNARIQLGDQDTVFADFGQFGGTTTAKFTIDSGSSLNVHGGTWKVGDVTINSSATLSIASAKLDMSGATLKVAADATNFRTDNAGTLIVKNSDFTLTGTTPAIDIATSNIKKQLENGGFLEIVGKVDSVINSATYLAYVSAITENGSTGAISLKDNDMGQIVGNTNLADVSTQFKGADLTTVTVKAGTATDALTNATYVKSVDATSVTGDYAVTGSTLVLAGNTDGTKSLIETASATNKINVADLQLGMVQKDASAGKLGDLTTTKLTAVNGSYTIATLNSAATSIKDGGTINVSGTMNATGNVIVGTSDSAYSGGTLTAQQLKLNGNLLFADPAWISDGVHAGEYGSKVAVAEFNGDDKNVLDGDYYAGQASQISLGTTDTTILSNLLGKSRAWGTDITAAMYIDSPIKLAANSAIHVNGATTTDTAPSAAPNQAQFADKSLLAVNAKNLGTNAAITAANDSTTATIAKDAKLHLTNAQNGQEYTILGDFGANKITYAEGGWSGVGNLLQKVTVLDPTNIGADGKVVVTVEGVSPSSTMPKLDGGLGAMLHEMNEKGLNDTDSPNAGLRFLSRSIDGRMNAEQATTTIEGAARLAVVGATQGVTMSAVTAGTSAATSRTSMASPLQSQKPQVVALNGETSTSGLNAGDVKNGVGLWIMPLYQSTNTWGMKAGEFKTGSTSDLGGVAIGADYTFAEAFRVGVAFNIGGGYAQSQGDFNKTDNNFNFWGVNLYGGWSQNNFGLTADVGYTSSYNKLEQELQSSMDMGAIKADVTSSAITAGLRGEYKFETEALDIIPHVGVRYMNLKTDSYDAKSKGTVFSADESYQSIWTFPIGVTLSKEIESASGWAFKPQLDLQIIPAAGDVKAKSKVRVPGLDATADLSTRVMDDFSYGAGVGFDVKKGDVSFGLNYTIQASEHSTAHGVFGTLRYDF